MKKQDNLRIVLLLALFMGFSGGSSLFSQNTGGLLPELPSHGEVLDQLAYTPSALIQTIPLSAGWNWVSVNVDITLPDLQNALVTALPNSQMLVKSQTQNSRYTGTIWRGTFDLSATQMYKIYVPADCSITLGGAPLNLNGQSITIVGNGNTYIGFPYSQSKTVAEAFAGFTPVAGDMVKSQTGNARYTGSTWRSQGLSTLEPGKGYIYLSASSDDRTLTFSTRSH